MPLQALIHGMMPPDDVGSGETQPIKRKTSGRIQAVLTGALAGGIATLPMTLCMFIAHRFLPLHQRTALPTRAIALDLLDRMHLKRRMNRKQRRVAVWSLHIAYGVGSGAFYGMVTRAVPLPGMLKGPLFGMFLWAASYLGWLPAFDVSGKGTDQPIQRNALMIGAHLVWGAFTGIITERSQGDRAS